MSECIVCFETYEFKIYEKKINNYFCKNICFFNKSKCNICNKCLDSWISYCEKSNLLKCPICAQYQLIDKNKKKCEYNCSCNIRMSEQKLSWYYKGCKRFGYKS